MSSWGFPSFGTYFCHLRTKYHLGRPQVAKMFGITASYISYLERGKRTVTRELLERITDASTDLSNGERGGLWLTAGFLPPSKEELHEGIAYLEHGKYVHTEQ